MIKWEEDSQLTIVTKVVNKNLFSLAFSENSCAAGSNYVPNLTAAMRFFFPIWASKLKIPLFKGFVLPPDFQVRRGPCLGSTTLYAIFGLYGSVFGHFLGVRGVAQCGSMAQNMPLGPIETGEQKNLLAHNF